MKRTIIIALAAVVAIAATPSPRATPPGAASHRAQTRKAPAAKQPAAMIPGSGQATAAFGVWTVHTTNVDAKGTGEFSAPNKLTILRPGGDATADRAAGNYKTKRMTLYGNVLVHDSQGAFDSGANRNQAPSTLTCNQLEIDSIAKTYVATGNVHYAQADSAGEADKATMNDLDHTLLLEGNVHVSQGDRKMSADRILYDTVTGDAHATGRDVTMSFPGGAPLHLATPRPLHLPFTKKGASPAPSTLAPSPAPKPT